MVANIKVMEKRCKSCGICATFCKKNVFEWIPGKKIKVVRPEECIGCRMCEYRCPDFALEVTKNE